MLEAKIIMILHIFLYDVASKTVKKHNIQNISFSDSSKANFSFEANINVMFLQLLSYKPTFYHERMQSYGKF